jgi:hypothetical protein
MEARHASECLSCVYGIRPGQQIRLDETAERGGRWEHVHCPTAPAVCGECFTEVARNGACMCGVS